MAEPHFIKSAANVAQCPTSAAAEVAAIGRSNVGKSSLLGALLDRPTLVRRSRTPGRTQLINFFETDAGTHLVDLPGYGFAKVPERLKSSLAELVVCYVRERKQLALVLLLIDARRNEGNDDDRAFLALATDSGRRVQVVVTKIDRVPKAKRKPTLAAVEASLGLAAGSALAFSAVSGEGKERLARLVHHAVHDDATRASGGR